MNKLMLPPVTPAQFNMMIAGLRVIQRQIVEHGEPDADVMEIVEDGGTEPLTADDIDDLCVRLNIEAVAAKA